MRAHSRTLAENKRSTAAAELAHKAEHVHAAHLAQLARLNHEQPAPVAERLLPTIRCACA